MFAALPEEEKGILRTTCIAPLLLINSITTMSTLVVEIFDRHLGDMKRYSSIKFVKKYTIISHPEQGEKRLGERNHIEAPTIGVAPAIELPAVGVHTVGAPIIENFLLQVAPGEGLEVVKDLVVDDDVEVGIKVNFKAISSEYGGDLLEWKKGDEKDDDDKKDVDEKASADQSTTVFVEEQTMKVKKTEDEASQVINVYIKALIPYLDTQHRTLEDKEKIVVADAFSYFADRSSPPTGPEVKDSGLNSKWTTCFGKCPIQPNGNDCGVYMFALMDNILRGMKFLDLIDGNECRYSIVYGILRLGFEP
ncbi:hypothetical protein GIB67_022706 [Kingdonia uniflora]|uniref:Ubiquitin-like protease family profile domain-containing protein n=1 Tax=Kingdonia uniflora TaxID=39325 RepID=A0A7J7P984_9MAGN|nr:hypothetical protein GIB67_022706 [Kingdonia uniflora]